MFPVHVVPLAIGLFYAMDEVKVISSDIDGSDLRRKKARARHYVRCDGKADEQEINDALASAGKTSWNISAEDWERIFGGKA